MCYCSLIYFVEFTIFCIYICFKFLYNFKSIFELKCMSMKYFTLKNKRSQHPIYVWIAMEILIEVHRLERTLLFKFCLKNSVSSRRDV